MRVKKQVGNKIESGKSEIKIKGQKNTAFQQAKTKKRTDEKLSSNKFNKKCQACPLIRTFLNKVSGKGVDTPECTSESMKISTF